MKNLILISIGLSSLMACKDVQQITEINDSIVVLKVNDRGVMCNEGATDIFWYLSQSKAPIFEGMDKLNYPITTKNAEAQKYFNQGLLLAYGFNHAEAARSFYESMRLDTSCAMCHWGFAYVLGPNYNAGMEPDNFERAYEAAQKAKVLSVHSSKSEKALIWALSERYDLPAPEDRATLDLDFSNALGEVYRQYPNDADVAALYAESLMNLHPWDLYDADGEAKSWTKGILEVLERVIELDPDHPGAHHFYIHAVESSATPERGYVSAKKFDDGLVPGSGHLIHMPSHIYIRTGDYAKGLQVNIRAVEVDSFYLSQCHAQGAYPISYYPHNMHFIAANALYAGNSHWAARGANILSDHANRKLMTEPGWGTLQHYYSMPYYIAVKFARWDDILEMNNFDKRMKYPEAMRHFARGMAYLGLKETESAELELRMLKDYEADSSLQEVTIWDINNVHTLVKIASKVLEAELYAEKDDYKRSLNLLSEAISLEDNLQYQEPTDWLLPVRHHLGAILIEAGHPKEAIEIYKSDLIKLPKNGWALKGLQLAYSDLGLKDQADYLNEEITRAWKSADIKLVGSRIW